VIRGEERVTGARLADGVEIEADLIVAGIGITPEATLAQQCGLAVEDGVITDRQCRTSDPNIFAIGDCARRPMAHYGERLARLESVHNAVEGAKIVAATILGQSHAEEAPWFWSDQYDLKLQIAGLFQGYDRVVFRGVMAERAFAAFYYKGDRLIAVDAVNRPAEYLGAKMLIQTNRTVAPGALEDMSRPMKEIVAAAR
jgi:3-phenylpropionate/trans-cinnamate dioxygenase ferredoxin reductase subunit